MIARALRAALLALALVLIAIGARAGVAQASGTQESIMQDDDALVFSSPDAVAHTLDEMSSLGVDRVRVSLFWLAVAPDPASSRRPAFDASDPDAYPAGAWTRYDTLVQLAAQRRIAVTFDVTGPAPLWATHGRSPFPTYQDVWRPSPTEFGAFVHAAGTRYDGKHLSGVAPAPPPPSALTSLIALVGSQSSQGSPPEALTPLTVPAVRAWSVWNEPDEAGWLAPQWRRVGHGWVPSAPVAYRRLVDEAVRALDGTGHATDAIAIGETASRGRTFACYGCHLRPLPFVRALFCVDRALRPLTGSAARELDCPPDGSRRTFAREHPGLVSATAYAHHPYSFTLPPEVHLADPEVATLADLGRLERTLDGILGPYGRRGRGRIPLLLDEYGYVTDPPNPFARFSPAEQATFINTGEYMAFADSRVSSFAQFLLVDSHPRSGAPVGSRAYWSTFQTGLRTVGGSPKPSLAAYRLPIWLSSPGRGGLVTIWGQVRSAPSGADAVATLEVAAAGSRRFAPVARLRTFGPRHFILTRVRLAARGRARLRYADPATGAVELSRIATVS